MWRKLMGKSPRQVAQRAVQRVARRLDVDELAFPLLDGDLADSQADSAAELPGPVSPATAPRGDGRRIAWLAYPPQSGSGGHTTLFRMMEACRAAGFANTLLLYNRYGNDLAESAATVRRAWPWLECDIAFVPERIDGFDAVVASAWSTAHVAVTRTAPGTQRLYFAQDFEPFFYPRGGEYAMAEDSYRLGLHIVSLGAMVRDSIREHTGVESTMIPFGVDREVYHALPGTRRRSGVLFYAKRGNDRRGYRLAVLALREFHRRHPDEPIHVYGDMAGDLGVPVIEHGSLRPSELNELYNSVVTGLALSFTNISLVAEEMLAAGAVPVVNDSPLARADLSNPHALWAPATPAGLAGALGAAVSRLDRDAHAERVARSVTTPSWNDTGAGFAGILTAVLDSQR
jgi:glycosyltransferase involved in cell wall biosynthesis